MQLDYNSFLIKCHQASNPQGAKVMRLGVQKKDEGGRIYTSENGLCGGECE